MVGASHKRRHIAPSRVDVELVVIAHGPEGLVAQTAPFLPCRAGDGLDRLVQCCCAPRASVKASDEKKVHAAFTYFNCGVTLGDTNSTQWPSMRMLTTYPEQRRSVDPSVPP